jgi:predicted nucleic acid-binding protein
LAVTVARAPAFFDTSILLGGTIELGPQCVPAQKIMAAVASGKIPRPQTAWHCCLEFYSVATRLPEGFRLSPEEALRLLNDEVVERFAILQLPEKRRAGFLDAAARERIAGGRIYDTHIAEIARAAGAGIVVTDNRRHFTVLLRHGVRVLTAAEFLADL